MFGDSSENGVPDWSPRGCKAVEKTVHRTSGVSSEALPRVSRHAGSAKYTLGRTSEMTHDGWCTVFSAGLHPLGRPIWHTVFTGNPQNCQKVPKIGVPPLFDQFFRKVFPRPCCRRFSKKKVRKSPPRDHPSGGGISALFSEIRR